MRIDHPQVWCHDDTVAKGQVDWFLKDGSWRTAAEIHRETGTRPVQMRKISSLTGMYVSGQQGYKRIDLATPEEIEATIAHLKSRIRHIAAHVALLERGPGTPEPQMQLTLGTTK